MTAEGCLTTKHIARLAPVISSVAMETIALGYLDIDDESVTSLKVEKKDQHEAFNRAILKKWANMNSTRQQVKTLASKLYEAAEEGGYMDPEKVHKILGVSKEESRLEDSDALQREKEVKSLIEDIRKKTLEDTSPEMAEWAKEFTPEIWNLKTKLTIRKIHNREVIIEDAHYKKLFPGGRRVLLKANHGWGKSTCCKKIAWDWANGKFTSVSVVFHLTVKTLKVGDSMESMIIEQYGKKGVNVEMQTLYYMFTHPAYQSLIIIDGLNEAWCRGNDIVNFVENNRNTRCNLLLTVGPEVSTKIEQVFPTVCEIEEITQKDSRHLVSSFMKGDQVRTDMIVSSEVAIPPQLGRSWSANPMLLMFFSFLVDRKAHGFTNEVTAVSGKNCTLCNLLLKLVLFLCGQSVEALCFSVKSFGKFLLDNLQWSRSNLYHKRDFTSILDGDLLCYKGEGIVMFAHETIEIFLAAFYFIIMIDSGESVDSILGSNIAQPVLFTNQLFLYFCLSMVNIDSNLPLLNREVVYSAIQEYTLKYVDLVQLDLTDISSLYPALDFKAAVKEKNEIVCKFLHDIFSSCRKTNCLFLSPDSPVHQVLTAMASRLSHLCSIVLANETELFENNVPPSTFVSNVVDMLNNSEDINILVQNVPVEYIIRIKEYVSECQKKLNVVFAHHHQSKRMIDISCLAHPLVKNLYVHQSLSKYHCFMFAKKEFPSCQYLTTLTLLGADIDDSTLKCLSKAVEAGNTPNVTYLSLSGSEDTIRGKLHLLFSCKWEKLVHLDLTRCNLDRNDVQLVCAETIGSPNVLLPVLSSLAVSDRGMTGSVDEFRKQWLGLTSLEIQDVHGNESMFINALKKKRFPSVENFKMSVYGMVQVGDLIPSNLNCLTIVRGKPQGSDLNLQNLRERISTERLRYLNLSYIVLSDNLCSILCRPLPVLETLVLRGCRLNAADLTVLAQANSENSLPKLKHLDIAFNPINYLRYLFEYDSKWSGLVSLTTDWMRIDSKISVDSLAEAGETGCLGSIETLSFITERNFPRMRETCRTCEDLLWKLHRSAGEYTSQRQFLEPINKALEKGLFSSLRSVYIHCQQQIKCDASEEKLKLRKRKLSVFFLLVREYYDAYY